MMDRIFGRYGKFQHHDIYQNSALYLGTDNEVIVWDHPFKTSACSRGGGVKNLPNLPTDSTKKLPTVGG